MIYLRTVCDYVHLNPVRAHLLSTEQKLRDFRWSSWPEYLKEPEQRPRWLRVDRLLAELFIPKDSPAGREQLENISKPVVRRKKDRITERFGEGGAWEARVQCPRLTQFKV